MCRKQSQECAKKCKLACFLNIQTIDQHNMLKCYNCFYYYSVKDIQNLEIISTEEAASNVNDVQSQSKIIVKRPIAKRAGRSVSECVPATIQVGSSQAQTNFKKPVEPNQQQIEQTPNGKFAPGMHWIIIIYKYSLHIYLIYVFNIYYIFISMIYVLIKIRYSR